MESVLENINAVQVGNYTIDAQSPLTIIAGPCVIESREHAMHTAYEIFKILKNHNVQFIFKASYDKANRTSIDCFRGPGIAVGLDILAEIRSEFAIPVVSDVHAVDEVEKAAEVLDLIQIPALLCRQTDIIVKAALTGKAVMIKKGQFYSPQAMQHAAKKVTIQGNNNVILCDRGTMFGYNSLISDMCAIPIMQTLGHPVCFDVTHSLQRPSGAKETLGSPSYLIKPLACAAVAAGANIIYLETQHDPKNGKSDANNMLDIKELDSLIELLVQIYDTIR